MKFTFLTLLITFLSFAIHAQHWQEAINKAKSSFESGNNEEAFTYAKEALNVAYERHGEHSNESINTLQLLISIAEGNPDEAIKYSNLLVEAIDKAAGKVNEYYIQASKNHQALLIEYEKYKEAIKFSESNKEIFKKVLGDGHAVYGQFCSDLAFLYYQEKDYDKAVENYRESTTAFSYNEGYEDYLLYDLLSLNQLLLPRKDFKSIISNSRLIDQLSASVEIQYTDYTSNIYNLGSSYLELKNHDSAVYYLTSLKQSLDEKPLNDNTLYNNVINHLALISDASGDVSKSQEILAQSKESDDKITLFNQAIAAQNAGNIKVAEENYGKLFLLDETQSLDQNDRIKLYENYSLFNLRNGKLDKALEYNDKAIDFVKKANGKKSQEYFKLIYRQGVIFNTSGKPGEAITIFKDLIADIEKNQFAETPLYVDVTSYYALLQQSGNNYSEALAYINRAIEVASKIELRKDDRASLYNNYSVLLQLNGEFKEAEKYQLQSLVLTKESVGINSSNYANGLINFGELLVKKGEFSRADSTYKIAKKLLESIYGAKSPEYAMSLISTTKLFKEQGKYVEADKAYIDAMEILNKAGDQYIIDYAFALNDYALLLQVFGNYRLAEKYFMAAANIFSKFFGENNTDYASALSNLATLYEIQGQQEKAEQILIKVLAIDKKLFGELHPKYGTTLHNLASILQAQNKLNEATKYYEQALVIDSLIYGPKHHSYANTLYNLADIYDSQEDYNKALKTYQRVLKIMGENYGEENPEYIYRLFGLARLFQRQHKFEQSLALYDKIIKHYLFQIQEYFPALSEDQKSLFYAKVNPIFNAYRELLINSKDPQSAERLFNLQLKTKALLLNASNKLKMEISRSKDSVVKGLYEKLSEGKAEILNYYSLSKEELKTKNINFHDLEMKINNLEKELSQRVQLFSEVYELEDYTWKDVQLKLNEKEVVVEIVRIEESLRDNKITYVATILGKTGKPTLIILPDGEYLEGRAFKFYRNAIKYEFADTISYTNYWQPISSLIHDADTIYLCPDGIYNKINLNTLYSTLTNNYFIDNYNIKYLSSTKEILKDQKINNAAYTASMFGYPAFKTEEVTLTASLSKDGLYQEWMTDIIELPGTRDEINIIIDQLKNNKWSTKGYLAGEALEANLKNIKSPRVLHIATHGFFSEDISYKVNDWKDQDKSEEMNLNPLVRSGILLTKAESSIRKRVNGIPVDAENDGILTAYEAMNLNLDNTDLVVLSACETGLGEVKNGEGVYGLQRAFLVSGASNIIMSLWKVDDNVTQELMSEFYSLWLKSGDLHKSFKEAQLNIKKKYSQPYLWGGFIINGK